MDSDKVLALAREAGFVSGRSGVWQAAGKYNVIQFAALIEQQMIKDGWRSPEQPSLKRYHEAMAGEVENDPVERLRFFLSLALTPKDWIDVEPFIDDVITEIRSRSNHE